MTPAGPRPAAAKGGAAKRFGNAASTGPDAADTSPTPRPGRAVRGSSTGRPIMALFDLVGRRWNLRIIWELHQAGAPLTFRELRAACGEISSSVLTNRLHELDDTLIATHTGDGYALTGSGRDLVTSMRPLLDWSRVWSRELER